MGSHCARIIDITHDIERRPTTTETRVAYDNSTWHAMNKLALYCEQKCWKYSQVFAWVTIILVFNCLWIFYLHSQKHSWSTHTMCVLIL